MNPPCYDEVKHEDCPRRAAGCAIDCPQWAEYVKEREKIYDARLLAVRAYVKKL